MKRLTEEQQAFALDFSNCCGGFEDDVWVEFFTTEDDCGGERERMTDGYYLWLNGIGHGKQQQSKLVERLMFDLKTCLLSHQSMSSNENIYFCGRDDINIEASLSELQEYNDKSAKIEPKEKIKIVITSNDDGVLVFCDHSLVDYVLIEPYHLDRLADESPNDYNEEIDSWAVFESLVPYWIKQQHKKIDTKYKVFTAHWMESIIEASSEEEAIKIAEKTGDNISGRNACEEVKSFAEAV